MSEEGNEGSSMQPKRRIKKAVLLSSGSDSDSDESVTASRTRKKRLRVISDNDGSESSGSSVVCAGSRRKRKLPKLRDSDGDSDTSGWATDHSDAPRPAPAASKPTSGFASDSSEGNSDKCSICLLRFTDQEVGTPQSCEHIFCLDCITEWSKNVNTCPVDRMTFDSIVVRACAGGRVLRTEPVQVVERRPSVDMLVVEDPTACEICGSTENEEAMLLCDGCDLGFHMQCLNPPLTEVPIDQWLCPNCDNSSIDMDDVEDIIYLSEMDDLFSDLLDFDAPLGPRPSPLREPRNFRRSLRNRNLDEPSTSSGRRGHSIDSSTSSRTSRPSRVTRNLSSHDTTSRRRTTTHRRKQKRKRSKTVIIEYEVKGEGKFPITKRVKRVVRKKTVRRRRPRTAARQSHVRASVRARLAGLRADQRQALTEVTKASGGVQDLAFRRHRAGVPSLSLFGNPNGLDYFSEDEQDYSEGAITAVAVRPTSSILNSYRQARRKMITIPSPPHASSAPDLLSDILESQTLLHSKKSVMSVDSDGRLNIKMNNENILPKKHLEEPNKEEKIDISKGEDATKKVPSYPGQSRGGGWGGGYRGNYHREQGSNNFNRNYDNNYGSGYQNRQGNSYHPNNNMRREEPDAFGGYARRSHPHPYPHPHDDVPYERPRRPALADTNRPPNHPPHVQRLHDQNRYSLGTSWPPYTGPASSQRQEVPITQSRHSFGGFENPLDMRMGQTPPQNSIIGNTIETFTGLETPRQDTLQQQNFQPLPEPPVFKFDKMAEMEKSEDEKSDSGLIIDTEKYDPTEPTNDDDSGDEGKNASETMTTPESKPDSTVSPPPQTTVQNIIAGIDTTAINVPPNILDSAVRQVLKEHRNLIVPPSIQSQNDKSDEDSDGDCPNFSIYSATSVHIANNTSSLTNKTQNEQPKDNLEDLVQEDDDIPDLEMSPATTTMDTDHNIEKSDKTPDVNMTPNKSFSQEDSIKKKFEEEYKEKVSKRCPITTSTRNPIKIKLNTPSLIKRQVSLYDEEDINPEIDSTDKSESVSEISEAKSTNDNQSSDTSNVNLQLQDQITFAEASVNEEDSTEPLAVSNEKLDETDDISIKADPVSNKENESLSINGDTENKITNKPIEQRTQFENEDDIKVSDDKSDKVQNTPQSEDNNDESDNELDLNSQSPKKDLTDRNDEILEKMTESISETEDERSYTPCLDENKSKDTSLEAEKEKGIEGLDTELISEEEANDMFSDNENERTPSERSHAAVSPRAAPAPDREEGEILEKRKERKNEDADEGKKKKKKESKKEGKDKSKSKNKKGEVTFKKLSKSGKERNYREREKEEKSKSRKDRASSEFSEKEKQKQKRKEKRKDLERYDVRTVVTEKRKKLKDPFGRDISPRPRSRSHSLSRSLSRARRSTPRDDSPARSRLSPSRDRRSPSRGRRSSSRGRRSISRTRRSLSRVRRSLSRMRRSVSRGRRSPSRIHRSPSRGRTSTTRVRRPRSVSGGSSPPSPPVVRRVRRSPRSPSVGLRRRPRPRTSPRRRRSSERVRKRVRRSTDRSPDPKPVKKKKRARSERPAVRARRRDSPRRKTPKRKKAKRRSASRSPVASPVRAPLGPPPAPLAAGWSPLSVDSRLLSPRTPPPDLAPPPPPRPHPHAPSDTERTRRDKRRRRDPDRQRHKRTREVVGPSKEVFTSGDNILVSVSFKDQERDDDADPPGERRKRRADGKRDKRKKKKRAGAAPELDAAKPVAIIDLERSPFRELTPSPKNVIVLSDSDPADDQPAQRAPADRAPSAPHPPHTAHAPHVQHAPHVTHQEPVLDVSFAPPLGPKTPPEPITQIKFSIAGKPGPAPRPPNPLREDDEGGDGEPGGAGPATGGSGARGPNTPPEPPSSPDAYDPFEPTRSASASPARRPPSPSPSPPRTTMTLEAAQKTNMSADEVLDRRPLSPIEKVMALLQSTRDVPPDPPPGDAPSPGASVLPLEPTAGMEAPPAPMPPAPALALPPHPSAAAPASGSAPPAARIVLPSPTRSQPPKLFLAKPSPIKSNPIKPMQATKISMLPLPNARRAPAGIAGDESDGGGESPYSPGSSDFGDLFEPPRAPPAKRDAFDSLFASKPIRTRKDKSSAAKVPVKFNRKKGKTQVGVKIDDDNLKILDDLPSSAVEMQVKSKFLKKLNRQERVVEEVKLVLKPHYNKKHVTKEEYKDILRRCVPKICHNKTGEINPTKIQALVEAYVKKFRKKHKLGLA